jgi:KilA-N domain
MTKAAQHFGKRLDKFWSSAETRGYIAEAGKLTPNGGSLVLTTPGRHGGTWAHPKLAVFFARWLDVRFAVWCDAMIEDILKGRAEVVVTKPAESAVMALPASMSFNNATRGQGKFEGATWQEKTVLGFSGQLMRPRSAKCGKDVALAAFSAVTRFTSTNTCPPSSRMQPSTIQQE